MTNATQQKWSGRWEQLAGKVKSVWGKITDDDLLQAKGDYERMVGIIKSRTGATEEEIEKHLNA